MANKVERVYALQEHCPHGLGPHLLRMQQAVLDHLRKEEEILFPAIRAGQGRMCGGPIACMESEHEEHAANLRRMRELAHGLVAPAGACTTFRALYQRLEHLERELMKHIHLENSILFPRALKSGDCCGFCQHP
jgi:regulator of cell morphogenesis and NO signaling